MRVRGPVQRAREEHLVLILNIGRSYFKHRAVKKTLGIVTRRVLHSVVVIYAALLVRARTLNIRFSCGVKVWRLRECNPGNYLAKGGAIR
jgi:hypothetical protein